MRHRSHCSTIWVERRFRMKTSLAGAALVVLGLGCCLTAQSSYGQWTAAELRGRDAALAKKVGPDHSARETLADYGDHRFRLLYRDADGVPEQHDQIVDVVFIQSGEGALQLGGTMVGKRAGSGPGEYLGT